MKEYSVFIDGCRLIEHLESTLVSYGHEDYHGTAIEVSDSKGDELFQVVIDQKTGEKQVLFFSHNEHYRVNFVQMKQVLERALGDVQLCTES